MIGIYAILNIESGDMYIGGSKQVEVRIRHNFYLLEKRKHPNSLLQNAFSFYNGRGFSATLLEECTLENLREREQWWIDNVENKYNLYKSSKGGSLPGRPSKMKGRKFSEQARQNMSKGSIGQRGPWSDKPVPQWIVDKMQEGRRRKLDAKTATKEEL